jgi:GNAT superfamily N-acetyltransferase
MDPATTASSLTIRPATPADVPALLVLIRELAEYERLLHAVTADEALLHEALFGARPAAEAVLAREGQSVVGFALWFHNFSTFVGRRGLYLEDLYVRPEYRGRGYGEALLAHLGRVALDRGCGRLEWAVLDWNRRAIDFYQGMGAVPMSEWTVYRVTGERLVELAARARST